MQLFSSMSPVPRFSICCFFHCFYSPSLYLQLEVSGWHDISDRWHLNTPSQQHTSPKEVRLMCAPSGFTVITLGFLIINRILINDPLIWNDFERDVKRTVSSQTWLLWLMGFSCVFLLVFSCSQSGRGRPALISCSQNVHVCRSFIASLLHLKDWFIHPLLPLLASL